MQNGTKWGAKMQLDDNKLLGVEQLYDDEVRKLIRDIALESK
jgi:hypothetical protein